MRRFTFPKRLQLRSRVDYNRVFSRCVRSSDDFFTVLARRNELQHARLGTVVSRRSAGNAVRRHRLKRLIREAFRAAQHELPAVDLVVLSRHGVSEHSNASLAASLHAHWRRIGSKCAH